MKAIFRTKAGPLLREVPVPELCSAQDVLVRVKAVSICRTDLYAAYGQLVVNEGRILGHEFTGIVEKVGDGASRFSAGARVVANPFLSCGSCNECKSGFSYRCSHSTFIGLEHDGAFAEFIVVPEHILQPLDDSISFSVGTFIEPVAAGMAIFETPISPDDSIIVLGNGRISRLTVKILKNAGFNNLQCVNQADDAVGMVDVVIETCGLQSGICAVFNILKPGGLLVIKSREPTSLDIPLLEAIRNQVRIHAVKYGPFEKGMEFVGQHHAELADDLDVSWHIDDFMQAFEQAQHSEDKKICFKFSD